MQVKLPATAVNGNRHSPTPGPGGRNKPNSFNSGTQDLVFRANLLKLDVSRRVSSHTLHADRQHQTELAQIDTDIDKK